MLNLIHHDDKKNRLESHEICVAENIIPTEWSGYSNLNIQGWGSTREEAYLNFSRTVNLIISDLENLLKNSV